MERNGPESITGEMRALVTQTERLIRSEITLAVVRGKEAMVSGTRRAGMLGSSAVLGVAGLAYLFHAVYSALSLRLESWAAALITAVLSFTVAAILAALALRGSDAPVTAPTTNSMAVQ